MSERTNPKSHPKKASGRRKTASGDGAEDPAASELAGLSFEEALERLEGVVDGLEQGDLDLEEALARFEEGVRLTQKCATQLEAAERRIEVLTREGGDWATRSFGTAVGESVERGEAEES